MGAYSSHNFIVSFSEVTHLIPLALTFDSDLTALVEVLTGKSIVLNNSFVLVIGF